MLFACFAGDFDVELVVSLPFVTLVHPEQENRLLLRRRRPVEKKSNGRRRRTEPAAIPAD
jgi:hypothetical protein